MSTINIPLGAAGAAAFESDTYIGALDLFYGSEPDPVTQNFPINSTFLTAMRAAAVTAGADVVIPVGYPFGINSSNELVAATVGSGTGHVAFVGVSAAPILNDSSDNFQTNDPAGIESGNGMPVFIQGNFNIDAMTWPAAFTTDTLKLSVARQPDGVRIGTVCLFGKQLYGGVIANPNTL